MSVWSTKARRDTTNTKREGREGREGRKMGNQLLRVVLDLVEMCMTHDRQRLQEEHILDDVELVFRVLYYAVHGRRPAEELTGEH